MKRYLSLLVITLIAVGCGSANKNTLAARSAKYPVGKYITKAAVADDKNTAKQNAVDELKKLFDGLEPSKDSDVRRQAVLSQIYAAEWWKDKNTKKYYALAVLERQPAQDAITPYYTPIDSQLGAISALVSKLTDKYARVKEAMRMPALLQQREHLDNEYKLIAFDGAPYDEEALYSFKAVYNKAFYDIKINAVVSGTDDATVKTPIIDAMNHLGFAVGEGLEGYDIELKITVKLDQYPSKSTDGLYWARASATVALKDAQSKGVFATFTTTQKDGSFRPEEAQRRSQISAGELAAPLVREKLLNYIQKK